MAEKKNNKKVKTKDEKIKLPNGGGKPLKLRTVETEGGQIMYQKLDQQDELQIMSEIKGTTPAEILVYEFTDKKSNRLITGLSYQGVKESVRALNARGATRISISPKHAPVVEETDEHIDVTVYAEDLVNGGGYYGTKRQYKYYPNGGKNEFAREQAFSKAQRNALHGLIPACFITEMIKEFRRQGKVMTINPQKKLPPKPYQAPQKPQETKKPVVDTTATSSPAPKKTPAPKQAPAQSEPDSNDAKINEKDLRRLFAKCKELGLAGDDVKRVVMGRFPKIQSRKDLSVKQLDELIKLLQTVKDDKAELKYAQDGSKIDITPK